MDRPADRKSTLHMEAVHCLKKMYRGTIGNQYMLVLTHRPPQSEFVPASAWPTIKCACQNVMSKVLYSQPYIEYINILKPQSCYLAYLKLNIQNKVSYLLLIARNLPDILDF